MKTRVVQGGGAGRAEARVGRRRGWGGDAGDAEMRVGRKRGWGGGARGSVVRLPMSLCSAHFFRSHLSLFPNAPLSPTRLLTYLMEGEEVGRTDMKKFEGRTKIADMRDGQPRVQPLTPQPIISCAPSSLLQPHKLCVNLQTI